MYNKRKEWKRGGIFVNGLSDTTKKQLYFRYALDYVLDKPSSDGKDKRDVFIQHFMDLPFLPEESRRQEYTAILERCDRENPKDLERLSPREREEVLFLVSAGAKALDDKDFNLLSDRIRALENREQDVSIFQADEMNVDVNYNAFQRDVRKHLSDRIQEVEVTQLPKEAFSSPEILAETLLHENIVGTLSEEKHWDSPAHIVQYLGDNMEEVCTVMDMSGKAKDLPERVGDEPEQVVLDVYTEEAKQLLRNTSFYFNQSLRGEISNNRLNREDLNCIQADLHGRDYLRMDDVIRFEGKEENGKPFTAEFNKNEMLSLLSEYYEAGLPEDYAVGSQLYMMVHDTADKFRTAGPIQAVKEFNTKTNQMKRELARNGQDEMAITLGNWQEEAQQCFTTNYSKGFGVEPDRKVLTKVREQDKELTLSR